MSNLKCTFSLYIEDEGSEGVKRACKHGFISTYVSTSALSEAIKKWPVQWACATEISEAVDDLR